MVMAVRCPHCASPVEESWRYCVGCGASTARLELPVGDVELAPIIMQRGGVTARRTLILTNRGVGQARARLRLEGAPSWARLLTAGEVRIEPMGAFEIDLELAPPSAAAASHRFQLLVDHDEGPRSPTEHGRVTGVNWSLTNTITSAIHLRVAVAERSDLLHDQDLLVFSHRITDRILTLRNPNADEVSFAVLAPDGVRATAAGSSGRLVVPGRNGALEGRADVHVSLDAARWRSSSGVKRGELTVVADGVEHRVRIHVIDGGGTTAAVPMVIGIDFGTDNTSVFARIPGSGASPEPVPILGSQDARVPSYIAYERDSTVPKFFGRDAKDLLSQPEKLQQDYRIEYDVKRWLRFAHDDRSRRTVLRDYLKRLYLDIEAFLVGKQMASYAGIKFVFTLPVLDQEEMYRNQRDVMRTAILEAFGPRIQRGITTADDFTFVTEPQAAAACFLFDEAVLTEMGLPGYEKDDLFAVVDSGAGTTDLALVRVTGEEGIGRFEVLAVRGSDLTDGDGGGLGVFGGRWVDEQLYDLMVRVAADGINRAYPDARATPESMRAYLEDTLQRAGLDHTSPEKYVEMVKPRLFTKVHASHKVQLRQVPLIRERALDPAIDTSRYLPSYGVTVGEFDERLRLTGSLDRMVQALDAMMTEGEAGERIQGLQPEQRHLRYIFAVGGNSHLPQLVQALKERFPGAAVLPGEGGRARTVADDVDADASSIRMIAVARGSVWSVGHDLSGVLPFRLTLRAAGQAEVVLLRENSPFTMQLPVQTFLVRPSQPYEAEVRVHLDGESLRIGLVRYRSTGTSDALVRRSLHFALDDAWVLTAVVQGGPDPEEVLRLALH
jgi:hypothetical protein